MKNPHAVALGKLGGKKGGKSRMESMTPEQRKDFARKGGIARQIQIRAEKKVNQILENKINDGRWAMGKLSQYKKIDWLNRHRERTISLFEKDFYIKKIKERIKESINAHSGQKKNNK